MPPTESRRPLQFMWEKHRDNRHCKYSSRQWDERHLQDSDP